MKLFIDASISSLDSQFNSIEPHQDICYMINDYVHADSAAVYIKVLNTSSDRSVVVVIVIVVIVIVKEDTLVSIGQINSNINSSINSIIKRWGKVMILVV